MIIHRPRVTVRRRARGLAAGCAGVLLASLALVATPGSASADPPPLLVEYDATGTSTIAKTNSSVNLGPAVLSTAIAAADGTFTGHLALPETRTSFRALGLLPTTATVGFREAAPLTGQLFSVGGSRVTSTATYFITLRNIKVAGLPLLEGSRCQTAAPVTIPANTPAGERFDLATGGRLTGTYTIGKFQNCGLATGILNLLVPGPNNTAELIVSNGRIVG